jgi:ComEC/Rec2-related protein
MTTHGKVDAHLTERRQATRWLQAVNGRPLATFCGSYLLGAAAGVTFSPPAVVSACLLASGVLWLLLRRRSLPVATTLLVVCAAWLGSAQGIRHTVQDAILWRTLPQGEAVFAVGEVVSEPVKRRTIWRFIFRARSIQAGQRVFHTPTYLWVELPEERLDNPHAGERLQIEGRMRLPSATGASGASFVDYLRRQGVVRTLRPYRVAKLDASGWRVFFSRLRRRLIENLRYHLPTREGHIAAAIVLNDRTGLDSSIRESFRRTGTVHILSPSGTHVSMLAVTVWAVCRLFRLSRRVSALAVIAVIWGFVGVAAGGEPSFRAAVMGTLVAGAVALQRELDLPTSLALAGFLIVLTDTGALLDPGFQFSFILVAAIIAAAGWLNALAFGVTGGRLKPVGGLLAAIGFGIVCAIASAPLTALYYGQMSFIAPLANLVIALPVQVLTAMGLAIACLPWAPDWLTAPVALSAWMVDKAVRWLALPAWASVPVSPPPRWAIAAFYALFFIVLLVLSARASARRRELAL